MNIANKKKISTFNYGQAHRRKPQDLTVSAVFTPFANIIQNCLFVQLCWACDHQTARKVTREYRCNREWPQICWWSSTNYVTVCQALVSAEVTRVISCRSRQTWYKLLNQAPAIDRPKCVGIVLRLCWSSTKEATFYTILTLLDTLESRAITHSANSLSRIFSRYC